jgi:DNA-binding beta-propeller fold protein YncE
MYAKSSALALVALTAGSCHGQTTFLPGPEPSWSTDFLPMGQGNGIAVSPDGTRLYATASDGTIGAMDPSDGTVEWTYKPTTGSTLLGGNGQASISEDGSYLAYGVTEDLDLPDESWYVHVA